MKNTYAIDEYLTTQICNVQASDDEAINNYLLDCRHAHQWLSNVTQIGVMFINGLINVLHRTYKIEK